MAYFSAGGDGIIIDSKEVNSNEVFKFSEKFWKTNQTKPIIFSLQGSINSMNTNSKTIELTH